MKLEITTIMRFDKHKNISHIIDFTGKKYYIDNKGKLYRGNTELVSIINNEGYIVNKLKDINGKYHYVLRHQLVAQTFLIDTFKEGKTVDHIDRNRSNNCVENLRWATPQEQVNNQQKIEQAFCYKIENQKEYFVNNYIPKFSIERYPNLKKIYDIHEVVLNGDGNDNLINEYATKYNFYEHHFVADRNHFYDFYLPIVKMYNGEKAKILAENTTTESVDINKFEELFLDKPYDKMFFKNNCMKLFAIKKEIFKNKNSIEVFLNKLGYSLKKQKDYFIIRKIKN